MVAPVAPVLTLNPGGGAPGDPIAISGTGFGANEVVSASLGAASVLSARTDNFGAFSGTFTVPSGIPLGTYSIAATGERTGALALASLGILAFSYPLTPIPTSTPTITPIPPPPTATPTITPGATVVNVYLPEGSTVRGTQESLQILNTTTNQAYLTLMLEFADGGSKAMT